MTSVKLTQYSKASGCGCKIAPAELEKILAGLSPSDHFSKLIVGNSSRDDAAVYDTGNGHCVISTVDFFTPITDNAFDFGQISACNAISDIYAMGGTPLMAVAILGWPVNLIPAETAQEMLRGAQQICSKAGIPLAGGHSVDTQEPLFGLAVTGTAEITHIKRNDTAKAGDLLYITKPLGIGILATALKRGLLADNDYQALIQHTTSLNTIGGQLGAMSYVHAMTDITGFGFTGHLLEMCHGSRLSAMVQKNAIPLIEAARDLASQFVFPDNTTRNYNAQAAHTEGMTDLDFIFYCDPQTSGGLLISVDASRKDDFERYMQQQTQFFACVGHMTDQKETGIIFI